MQDYAPLLKKDSETDTRPNAKKRLPKPPRVIWDYLCDLGLRPWDYGRRNPNPPRHNPKITRIPSVMSAQL